MNNDRIYEAQRIIAAISKNFRNPVVMTSFGKDSMVLLHLVNQAGHRWPCIFNREPFFPKKQAFANRIIEDWNLTMYDYPPRTTSAMKKNGRIDIFQHHQIGQQDILHAVNVDEPKSWDTSEWLCSVRDLLMRPTGTFNYPWDVALIGHKSSDTDPMMGDLTIDVDFKHTPGSASVAFPIRTWTDQDIWDYTEAHSIPIHHNRYEKVDGKWRERDDKSYNPDFYPGCSRCIDPDGPESVLCPLVNAMVNNISASVQKPVIPDYVGEKI